MKTLILTMLCVLFALPAIAADKGKESAYDRMMRTGTIRCGYGINNPWIYQDLKTSEMKGLYVDIMEMVAAQIFIKLEWPEETGWGNIPTSLINGRVDATCGPLWIDPARARQVAFTRPLFFTPIYAYARTDDNRFSGLVRPEDLNDPSVRIVTLDGNVTDMLTKRYYAKATPVSLPQSSAWAEGYLSVTTGKGDVIFSDATGVAMFNANQDDKLKKIDLSEPVTVYGSALAVSIHEQELKEMLDATVSYLLNSGQIQILTDEFVRQYPGALISVPNPYAAP